jgi:hypothetical protein
VAVPTTTETTSTARYRVVALATTLAMVTYLIAEMGWIFTAFQLAYGLFEIPTGRVAERGADVLALDSAARARSGPRDLPLYVMGALFLVGAGCGALVDPSQPVFAEA